MKRFGTKCTLTDCKYPYLGIVALPVKLFAIGENVSWGVVSIPAMVTASQFERTYNKILLFSSLEEIQNL